MKAKILLVLALVAFLASNVSAYGYVYDNTPYSYYSYERWNGYESWDYYSPTGRHYSYYGPSYYGSYYGSYYSPYYFPGYRQHYYYQPVVYYYEPYYNYYDYGVQYYSPGFSMSVAW